MRPEAERSARLTSKTVFAGCVLAELVACAAQKPPDATRRAASSVVSPERFASVECVRLVSNDAVVRAEAEHRMRRKGGPAPGSGDACPVLSLQVTCGSDFVFLPSELSHPSCLGMDRDGGDYLSQRYTPPDRTRPGCGAAASLTMKGEAVWWMREEIRVQSRGDLLAAADRMVDQFLEDWKRARGGAAEGGPS